MPYIKQNGRARFNAVLEEFTSMCNSQQPNSGDLNYIITNLFKIYIDKYGKKYDNYNMLLGVLEAVKLELYRRQIAPYEDTKIEENGDVY